jgi:hypothetical protein
MRGPALTPESNGRSASPRPNISRESSYTVHQLRSVKLQISARVFLDDVDLGHEILTMKLQAHNNRVTSPNLSLRRQCSRERGVGTQDQRART